MLKMALLWQVLEPFKLPSEVAPGEAEVERVEEEGDEEKAEEQPEEVATDGEGEEGVGEVVGEGTPPLSEERGEESVEQEWQELEEESAQLDLGVSGCEEGYVV